MKSIEYVDVIKRKDKLFISMYILYISYICFCFIESNSMYEGNIKY
jgi:hypothetical protein